MRGYNIINFLAMADTFLKCLLPPDGINFDYIFNVDPMLFVCVLASDCLGISMVNEEYVAFAGLNQRRGERADLESGYVLKVKICEKLVASGWLTTGRERKWERLAARAPSDWPVFFHS